VEKVLVTGGAGFIGSHTVDLLLRRGYRVRVMDSLTPPVHPNGRRPAYLPEDVEFMVGDVRSKTDWTQALAGVDGVFHLAAYQDYLPDFSKFFHVNTVATSLLYEVIVESRLPIHKVVVASSQAAYGEGKYHCAVDGTVYPPLRPERQLLRRQWEPLCPTCGGEVQYLPTDELVVNPHNQYAMSKYTQEMIALNLGRRYGIPSVAMRYSITQGPRQSFTNAYSGILRIFTLRLLHNRPPIGYEDGHQVRDYVSVRDVAAANLLVFESAQADDQVFNVGGDRQVTVREYASLLARKLGKPVDLHLPGEFRFGDTRHIVSDVSRLRALGWTPATPLDTIVDEYLAWVMEQPEVHDYSSEAERMMKAMGTVRIAA
jgi:dTDP-L-rhamnose 4-epimerase